MKINGDFILKEIESTGKFVVVAVGKTAKKFNGMISFNSTGAFMWEQLKKNITEAELVGKILQEYDVSKEVAEEQVSVFINKLKEAELIKE